MLVLLELLANIEAPVNLDEAIGSRAGRRTALEE
jgi:hypothetical protein